MGLVLVFALFLTLSRYGDVRLGPGDSEPGYSSVCRFAMPSSAGTAIGLIQVYLSGDPQHYEIAGYARAMAMSDRLPRYEVSMQAVQTSGT